MTENQHQAIMDGIAGMMAKFEEIMTEQRIMRDRIIVIERYLENQFLIGQHIHLNEIETMCAHQLKSNPKDVSIMMKLSKTDNDRRIIDPRMHRVNAAIFQELEMEHGNGIQFKYFKTSYQHKPAGPSIHVIGK